MKHLFVIDDTGSPGNAFESQMLKSDRKTYVAVFINKIIKTALSNDIKHLLQKYSINEFHFTDIINRRKEFKDFSSEQVMQIFTDFIQVVKKYNFAIFVQTMTPRTIEENGLTNKLNKSVDEMALDFLFIRMKEFIISYNYQNQFDIVIDEDPPLRKAGNRGYINILREVTVNSFMSYDSSINNLFLQIADFYAFTINRFQMQMIKESRSDFEQKILTLLSMAMENNLLSGIKATLVNLDDFRSQDYDTHQQEYWKEMRVYNFWLNKNK